MWFLVALGEKASDEKNITVIKRKNLSSLSFDTIGNGEMELPDWLRASDMSNRDLVPQGEI